MAERKSIILISNDFSHPALSGQQFDFSWRINRVRPLTKTGYRVVVVSAGGKVGRRGLPTLSGLKPSVRIEGDLTVVSPPLLRIPLFWLLQSLIITPIAVFLYCKANKLKVDAIVASSVVYGAIGKVLNRLLKTALVVDYGDPDFARETSLSLKVLTILESYVFQGRGVRAVTYIDPNIGRYLGRYKRIRRMAFLPPGGYWADRPAPILPRARGGEQTVLYSGHVAPPPTYRLDLLVPAAASVLRSRPSTQFVVVGAGAYLRELRDQSERLGIGDRFKIRGGVSYDESKREIATSDVCLQLLNDMCLGTKVMDYFALGRPVVACGSFYDSYDDFLRDGENCLLVPPDPERLAQAITSLLEDGEKRRSMGEAAMRTIKAYDWVSQSQMLLRLIEDDDRPQMSLARPDGI